MIEFLIKNWKDIAVAIAAFGFSYMLHTLDVHRIEAKQVAEIQNVKQAMTAKCDQAKAITNGVSHDYQSKLAALDARLSSARSVYNGSCLSVQTAAAAGHDAAAAAGKPIRRNVDGTRFIEIAGRAEKYRLQLISCQRFITLENAQEKLAE